MLAGLIAQGALGIGETAVGLINAGKANAEAEKLRKTRPKLKDSPYLKDDLALAESDLSTGMSADAKRAYEEGMDRDLSTSLGAITRMGGSPNNVGSVFADSTVGRARLAMMKDNLRLSQITNVQRARAASEEERQKEFQFNEWAPWADAAQANAAAKSNAQSEIFGGLNALGAGVMRFDQQRDSKKDFNNYFSTKPSTTSASTASSGAPDMSFLDGLLSGD